MNNDKDDFRSTPFVKLCSGMCDAVIVMQMLYNSIYQHWYEEPVVFCRHHRSRRRHHHRRHCSSSCFLLFRLLN